MNTSFFSQNKSIVIWLLSGCVLIYLMVLIGGITRLTGSGLSITEWNVIMGTVPPLTQQDWQDAYQKYQQSPQFQKINYDMKPDEFKNIFFWEYLHRLIGRLIGMVFIIPFLYFIFKKQLNRSLIKKLLVLFLLGALQGVIGWYMVKSGLIDNPHVSHYRLATHLVTAFITFGFTFYVALDCMFPKERLIPTSSRQEKGTMATIVYLSMMLLIITVVQIIYGAFVAGLHAGKIYNTFPKMGDEWIPLSVTAMAPFFKNFLENIAGVQFVHRSLAWLVVFFAAWLWFLSLKNDLNKLQRRAIHYTVAAVALQFLLGMFTLLYSAPITLSLLHQTGAFLLFTSLIFLNQQFRGVIRKRGWL